MPDDTLRQQNWRLVMVLLTICGVLFVAAMSLMVLR